MDGYDFIRTFRELEVALSRAVTPAIALTACARSEDQRRAMVEGFQLHVAKPGAALRAGGDCPLPVQHDAAP